MSIVNRLFGEWLVVKSITCLWTKGLSIKDVRTLQSGGFVQCGHFEDKRGSSDADVKITVFGAKNFGFFGT